MHEKQTVTLTVNGETHTIVVDTRSTLLHVLRDQIGLTGAKRGCNHGVCGACTVLIDDEPMRACLSLAVAQTDRRITTIEGLAPENDVSALQKAFVDHQAIQCGFCTPGMIIQAKGLLDRNPRPSVDEIRDALSGNICRCTGYVKIVDAVRAACEGEAR